MAVARPDIADAWRMPLAPGTPRDPGAWRQVLPASVRATGEHELLLGEDASPWTTAPRSCSTPTPCPW
ncbi:hypothetical protein [Streptomyces sp. NPDC101115]|uniref:hypothetical protein n=1 Tax=Streptomyces sp. NPDC101115 TaxID=3366106 RepID=UPI00381E2983